MQMLVIKIEDIPPLDETAAAVYRFIARRLKGETHGFVLFDEIAQALNLANYIVEKAVARLRRKQLIEIKGGALWLLHVVALEE